MALDIIESAHIIEQLENFIDKIRPDETIRDKLDISYKIENQSVIIYEIRPYFKDKNKIIEEDIAKTTYVRTKKIWKIFWQRADLKWHPYDPAPEVTDISTFLKIVKEDKFHCFWG